MSRIRCIKPEMWTSEQVISCSPLARLLFIGLWNFCDDNGIHPASYVRIKAEVFPADNFSQDEIKKLISELINNDLLREYIVDNKSYWIVTGWKKHQRIDKPTYRHPLPQSELNIIPNHFTKASLTFDEHSTNIPRVLDENTTSTLGIIEESSPTDRKGMDGNGKEEKICEVETSPCVIPENKYSADTQEVFSHWQSTLGHPRAKLDIKRKSKILQALKMGYTANDLIQAIDGCAKTPFNMGENDRRQRYDDIELILRDASHIDRFISNADNPPSVSSSTLTESSSLMAGVI